MVGGGGLADNAILAWSDDPGVSGPCRSERRFAYLTDLEVLPMVSFFALLLVCQLAGEVLVVATGVPLPGPVVGMVILFVGLSLRGEIPARLERLGQGLLSNLSLLFVPAGVGVMIHAELVGAEIIPIAVSLLVSTLLAIVVTGWVMQKLSAESDQ